MSHEESDGKSLDTTNSPLHPNQSHPSEARAVYMQRIAELKRTLQAGAQRRYSAKVGDAPIRATVDGTGKLLGIEVPDACLKQAHPQGVSEEIVAAIRAARALAAREQAKGK
ncbi:YbaB/EbfC family nucleoid-associated protein [Actinoallomurus sp. NPDC050550]|uniref:YbaB/EbfC family nucleoid-associated protein n=1 Tax=Actinoallomurus sp. NPDC050550 TaxID=3154937 RepID=UPI0033D75CDE